MSELARAQREFLDTVLSEAPADGPTAVYRRNVLANLHDALAAAYPVVRRLVGDAFFGELAARFARAHPSRSGDLHRYGAELAPFVARYAPARGLAYLADVARLEWAVAQAFHAADARAFDYAGLAAVPAAERPALKLLLEPAARLIASDHPIVAIWEANQAGRDGTPEVLDGGDLVLVHRVLFTPRVVRLSASEWMFLAAIDAGMRLGDVATDEVLAPLLAGELAKWTRAGVIERFVPCPPGG